MTPTTSQVQVLTYGPAGPPEFANGAWRRSLPADTLREMHIVDTPGTNAILREHEALTRDFVPRADLILFVTSADRPFTESERAFLEMISDWGKKIVLIVNKIDLLDQAGEREEVMRFVTDNAERIVGGAPTVFAVSARDAMRESLERYRVDVRSEFETRLDAIDSRVMSLRERGEAFLDDRLRLGNIRALLDGDRLREDFETEVIGDAPDEINDEIGRSIDWIIDQESAQRREIRDRLEDRAMAAPPPPADAQASPDDPGAGEAAGREGFAARRRALLETIGRDADAVLESFDPRIESRRLERDVQETLTRTALLEVGAIGLGVLIPLLATAHLLDFTGVLAGSVLAAVGFTLLPYRRRQAAKMLRERVAALRDDLRSALKESFERELERTTSGMAEAISPYEAFVVEEQVRIEGVQDALAAFNSGAKDVREKLASSG